MPSIDLNEQQVSRLLTILERNEVAIDTTEAIRWDEESANAIAELREDIAIQSNVPNN